MTDVVIEQTEQGFTYKGFRLNPEVSMTLLYYEYSITKDGQITELRGDVAANCGPGIIY